MTTEQEIDISGDGGIKKIILHEGSGEEQPPKGSEVKVHYVGRLLDGTVFDSSRDRGDHFKFKLGEGQVIKAWDQGVATMKKGELCKLICAPEYAYGKRGSPPKIPADSTLVFEVELFSWKSDSDLTDDGGVSRDKVKPGSGYQMPDDHDEIRFTYSTTDEQGNSVEEGRTLTAVVGGGALPRGLELALKKMKRGEAWRVRVARGYLDHAGPGEAAVAVPAGAQLLVFEVTLDHFTTVTDVNGDGSVVTKNVKPSTDYTKPHDGATVQVRYTGRLPSGEILHTNTDSPEPLEFTVGEGTVPVAWDLVLPTVKKGETVEIKARPAYVCGPGPSFPPLLRADLRPARGPVGEDVTYELELVGVDNSKTDVFSMNEDEKLQWSVKSKDLGNTLFKAGGDGYLALAVKKYGAVLEKIEYNTEEPFKEVRKAVLTNLALAQYKLGRFSQCVGSCDKVVKEHPAHVKCLFKRGQAHMMLGAYTEAGRDFAACADLDPALAEGELKGMMARLKKAEALQDKKDKGVYAKMLKGL